MGYPLQEPGSPGPVRLIEEAPALANPGWLPADSGWQALDALAAEHRRILQAREQAGRERVELQRRFEAEDRAHQDALRESFRTGQDGEPTAVTPAEERRALSEEADRRLSAANDALDDFLADAARALEDGAAQWLGDLADRQDESRAKREEAARLLAEAEREEQSVAVMRSWVERNAGLDRRPSFRIAQVRFMAWQDLAASYRPEPAREADETLPDAAQLEVKRPPDLAPWDAEQVAARLAMDAKHPGQTADEALRHYEGEPDPAAAEARTAQIRDRMSTWDSDAHPITEGAA